MTLDIYIYFVTRDKRHLLSLFTCMCKPQYVQFILSSDVSSAHNGYFFLNKYYSVTKTEF